MGMKYSIYHPAQDEINLIVNYIGNDFNFSEGVPSEVELPPRTPYVEFIYEHYFVRVWLNGQLKPSETRLVSHKILNYMKEKTHCEVGNVGRIPALVIHRIL
jgi:hypothetical protein